MEYSERLRLFEQIKAKYAGFLTSVLWKLSGDNELFAEAMQYALMEIWRHVEKLKGDDAGAYVYRVALTANSKAWQSRIGRDGERCNLQVSSDTSPFEQTYRKELSVIMRQAISRLPVKQVEVIVMRYFEQDNYASIANKMCCSEAGARSNVSKALATLRSRLAGYMKNE